MVARTSRTSLLRIELATLPLWGGIRIRRIGEQRENDRSRPARAALVLTASKTPLRRVFFVCKACLDQRRFRPLTPGHERGNISLSELTAKSASAAVPGHSVASPSVPRHFAALPCIENLVACAIAYERFFVHLHVKAAGQPAQSRTSAMPLASLNTESERRSPAFISPNGYPTG